MEQTDDAPGGAFICAKCGMSFGTQEQLDRHVQKEHGERDEETASE
jgi:uncharacterized C2H2 Zn-finger protein